ncbi:MAG: transporter [Verrucomicrobiales bacterium]|nr:transporter [Verrucomicrobiales bacterium]
MNSLRKRELLLSLKYATMEACFSVPMLNLTTGNLPFAIGFAVKVLGWGPTAVGVLAATPHICYFLQPIFTVLLQKVFSLYEIMLLTFVANALPWAFVPYFTLMTKPEHVSIAFALIVFISNLANAICGVAWSAAMSELVPLNIRGKYFGSRNMIFGFWTLIIVLLAGYYVDLKHNSLVVFGWLYTAAAAARLVGMFFLTRMHFPQLVKERRVRSSSFGEYLAVLKDVNYRWLLLFIGCWGFALNLGMPFYSVYVLRGLGLGMRDLTVFTVVSSLGGLLSLKTWGRLSDRFGNKPVLTTCSLVWAGVALLSWIMAGPHRYTHLFINYFVVGFMTAGFQLCQFNLMIKLVPADKKSHYISVFFAFTSLLTAMGPLAGGRLVHLLPASVGTFMGEPLTGYHLLFAGSLILCLFAVHILGALKEPAERPVWELVRVMRNMREFNPVLGAASLAQFMFTPKGLGRLARTSYRSLKRQRQAMSDMGEQLAEGSWKVVKKPFSRSSGPRIEP